MTYSSPHNAASNCRENNKPGYITIPLPYEKALVLSNRWFTHERVMTPDIWLIVSAWSAVFARCRSVNNTACKHYAGVCK